MALHGWVLRDVPPDPAHLGWLRYWLLTSAFLSAPNDFWGNLSATWTVSLFAVFYLTVPLWRKLIRGTGSAAALYLGALAVRYLWVALDVGGNFAFLYYLHFFLLGMWVRCLERQFRDRGTFVPCFVFSLCILGLAALLASGPGNEYFVVWSWGFAFLLLACRRIRLPKGPLGKAVRLVDRYSYEIYLVHATVMDLLSRAWQKAAALPLLRQVVSSPAGRGAASVFLLGTAVAATALGAFLARKYVDEPAARLAAWLEGRMRRGKGTCPDD